MSFKLKMLDVVNRVYLRSYNEDKVPFINESTGKEIDVVYDKRAISILKEDEHLVSIGDVLFREKLGRFEITSKIQCDLNTIFLTHKYLSFMQPLKIRKKFLKIN